MPIKLNIIIFLNQLYILDL